MSLFQRLIHEEDGATATEYAIIVAVLGVALVGIFFAFQDAIAGFFADFTDAVDNPAGAPE